MTNCCGSKNTLVVGRPTQSQFNQLCSSGTKSNVAGCGGNSLCGSFTSPHDRPNLTARKHRGKVKEDIADYVLLMLGAPTVKVELDQQQLDLAVDQAMKVFEEYAGQEFFDYYTFRTVPGKSVYKMPDDIGIVRNVFYKETGSFAFQGSDMDGAIPIDYFYPGGSASGSLGGLMTPNQPIWGRMGEWVQYKQYEQMFSRVSSNLGGWEWVSDLRHIKLYPAPCNSCLVIVHYLQKCKDWKEVNQAMQEGAYAYASIMLGNNRGKYQQPPGPGGGMALDGEYHRNKGWELLKEWKEDLIYRFGDLGGGITMD